PTHIDILPTGETTEYQNFQLPYWLAFAKKYDTENAVFLVRTKATKHGAYTLPNANNLYTEYRIANDTNTDAQDGKGYADFKEKLHDIITQQMEQRFPLMPTQWWKVQQAVEREAAAGKNILAKAEFIAFCKAENLDESNQRTLLNYLHNTGTFFYDETRFGNTVILNQQWAIDAIYTLFERGSVHRETILRAKGRFTQQHLAAAWQQYDDKTQNLFLAFMQSCDVCFTYPDSKKEGVETFIAPALMPEKKSEETQSDWEEKDDNEYFIRYAHPFLHYGIIQRFIVETHQYAKTVSIWKNGTVIKDSSNKALIEAEFGAENPCILVRVRGNNPKSLLDKIRNKLQEIEGKTAFQLSFSLDGEKYEKEEIVERYQLPKYAVFMGRNEDVRFEGNKLDRILEFVKRIDQTTTETHDNVKVIQITLAAFYQSLNDIKKGITDLDTDIAGLTKLHEALDKGSASIATEQSFQTFLNTIKSEWFGGDVKLKDGSLRDLAAALYYYNAQKDRADMMDYSAIVLHLGKAVEFELNERIKNKLIEVCIESETKRIENKDIKTKRLKRTVTLGDASKLKEELQKVCNKNFPFSLGVMYGCFQDIDKLLKSPNENTVKGLFDAVFTNPNAVFEKHQSNNDFYYTLMYELKHGAKSIPAFRNTSAHSGSIIRKAQAEKYINTVKTFLKEWNKALK
ncbi:MAG: hypothetical protein RI894_1465, partial [Bacteroidota bacterium]